MKRLIMAVIMFFFIAGIAIAETSVTLEWSPNAEPDLAGYRVFARAESQSYNYVTPAWEGTDTICTIYRLDETKDYYFVARAFDTEDFESGDSNEVSLEGTPLPDPEDGLPPGSPGNFIKKITTTTTTIIEGS